MRCPKCYVDNPDTSRFCGNCATALISAKASPPSLTETLESPVRLVPSGTVYAGRYEILGQIGAGGMGEVYRALDKNLGRHVAIKTLPAAFAEDKERMARFEREAKVLAVLNHPNIAAIHGLEESEGRRFLVLELAEGETLQSRLNKGPLLVDEALETCREIAEGLEAAHEKGIIHRDLKPGNIMITPEGKVKILDFGLAKACGRETTGVDIEKSPTITAQMTEPGVILGTAAYMSPEQARGRAVDRRSDIWAFGCVLYECLTGSRAFNGETVSDTLARILEREPDWSKLPAETPTLIKVLLCRCLQKDPRKRLHDIADARLEIETPAAYPSTAAPVPRRLPLLWLAAGAAAMLLAGLLIGLALIRNTAASPPVVTSILRVVPGHWLEGLRWSPPSHFDQPSRTAMAISSDGRFIVYSAVKENPGPQDIPRLYLRRTDQLGAAPIAGTEGGLSPFLSPDDRWVGFWAGEFSKNGKLMRVAVDGGVPLTLCDAAQPFGASWGAENDIVFSPDESSGLFRVSTDGGTPEILTTPDQGKEEVSHRLPHCLPDGKGVLFTIMRDNYDLQPRVAVLDLKTRKWRDLIEDAADARYVPTGHLIFLRQGTLMIVPFDLGRHDVTGQPVPVVANVMQALNVNSGNYNTAAGQFSISDSGWLAYAEGGITTDNRNSLVWVDQDGRSELAASFKAPFFAPRLSPDGHRIVYLAAGMESVGWIYDLDRGIESRLTDEGKAAWLNWTPDGQHVVFGWYKSGQANLYLKHADGGSAAERLTTSDFDQEPGSWSPDGTTLAFCEWHPEKLGNDILLLDVGSRRVTPFLNSQANESHPEFSPDGRWIAYASTESGREVNEVYVRPFPGPGGRLLISHEGGVEPLWARDGKRLFYRSLDAQQVWVVDIRTDGGLAAGKPHLLFKAPGFERGGMVRSWDLSPDGRRFLMVKLEERVSQPATEMILVQNWFEAVRHLVPAGRK
jgi:serine/threonine-protein kinase